MERAIALLDLDYFYAQCELLRMPEIAGKPVVIVMPSVREGLGAVATCNYEARALKIRSGMALGLAKKLANKETIFLNADRDYYEGLSMKVFEVVDFFCEKVEQVSVDEAYLDLTNAEGFGKAKEICQKIKQRVFAELSLTCTIGLGPNKLIAKMASSMKKPDGFFAVPAKEVDSFLGKQKVSSLFGVGPKTEGLFKEHGIAMVQDIKKFSRTDLVSWLGEANGSRLYDFAFGKDEREVDQNRERKQLSRMMTIKKDSRDFGFICESMDFLAEMLYREILAAKKSFKTVSIIIITTKMDSLTKSRTMQSPVSSLDELKTVSGDLLKEFLAESQQIVRRVGVRASNFEENPTFQRRLFEFK